MSNKMGNNHEREWCMCTELKGVARDMYSTCSICGGQDAYGFSKDRPQGKKKKITFDMGIVSRDLIIKAWIFLRENEHTIPDDVLDFMRDSAIEKLNGCN